MCRPSQYLNDLDDIPGSQDIGVKLDMSRVGGKSYHCFSHTIHANQCVLNPAQGGGQPTNLYNIETNIESTIIVKYETLTSYDVSDLFRIYYEAAE